MGGLKPIEGEQYFEDFEIGDIFRAEPVAVSEADIVGFAKLYDPQVFHTDPEAAKASQYGGLIASGMQVMALGFRSMIDAGFLKGGGMGSPGLDTVRWHKPVRPGDTITMQATVKSIRESETRADRGYVTMLFETHNQKGECVMSYDCVEIMKRRG
jgi:acyl dehydratase